MSAVHGHTHRIPVGVVLPAKIPRKLLHLVGTLHEPTPYMDEHVNVAICSMVVMIIVVICGGKW